MIGPEGGTRFRDNDNFDIVKILFFLTKLNDFIAYIPLNFSCFELKCLPWFNKKLEPCFRNVVVVVKVRHVSNSFSNSHILKYLKYKTLIEIS